MAYELLHENVRTYVSLGSRIEPEKVIRGYDDKIVPPKGLYATARLTDDEPVGQPIIESEADAGDALDPYYGQLTRQLMRATYSVRFYGQNGEDAARLFRLYALSDLGVLKASAFQFSLYSVASLGSLPDWDDLDANWEYASHMELMIDYEENSSYDEGKVGIVPIELAASEFSLSVEVDENSF